MPLVDEARPQHFCLYKIMYSTGRRHISQSITTSFYPPLSLSLVSFKQYTYIQHIHHAQFLTSYTLFLILHIYPLSPTAESREGS